MVLYKKQKATLSEPLVLPSEFGVDTKVFVIRETGEWFPKYSDYIKRLWFYMQNNFTCEITSHTNLTFFQAMASEEEEFNRLEMRFPIKIRAPLAQYLHFNPTSRFDLLLEETYFKFKKLFFVDEVVFLKDMNITDANGNIINNISDNIFVTEFLRNHNMYFDRDAAEAYQTAAGLDDNTNEIGVDLSNKWEVKEIMDPTPNYPQRYRIYQPSSFIFIEVDCNEIRRERKSYTRHLVRSFMKLTLEKASRKNGSPWRVKEDYIQHYDLSPEWPVQFLKYKEVPKNTRGSSETGENTAKKRGRPKSNNTPLETDEKSTKKKQKSTKKEVTNDDFKISKFSNTPSDDSLKFVNKTAPKPASDAVTRKPTSSSFTKITPEPSLQPQKPKIIFNPNVVKPKMTIVNDDEIPRVIDKFNDMVSNNKWLKNIREIVIKSIREHDKFSPPKSDEELYDLFSTLYYYSEANSTDELINSSFLNQGFKQYDEKFAIKAFSKNRKTFYEFDFFLILRIYIFIINFNEVLCLEVPRFQDFLVLLNNESQNEHKKKYVDKVAFKFVSKPNEDEQSGLTHNLKTKMDNLLFKECSNLDLVPVSEKKDVELEESNEDSTDLNKFTIELICCLLRLFIDEKGNWSVEIPNKWYSPKLKKECDKEDAVTGLFNEKEIEFLESCSKFKDVSFSERLMNRQFANGNWCLILLGLLEDSIHVMPLQDKMINIIMLFIGDGTVHGNKTLNTKLLANFGENFKMKDRLNIIYVLMELVTNYSTEMKQEVDKFADYSTFLKSERFKTARSMKPISKEINSLLDKKSKLSTTQPNKDPAEIEKESKEIEEQIKNLQKQVACKEQIKEFWDSQVKWAMQLRSKSLGSDRYGNTYWYLESHGSFNLNTLGELTGNELKHSGKIFIQGPKKNEIPRYYNGITYEEYLKKIEKYQIKDDGCIVNDENKLILLNSRIWNNLYTNKDLSVLDWKFIDCGRNFLVSEDDWCFIDDTETLNKLLNWLYKFGSTERHLKSNISSILESLNHEHPSLPLLYNEEFESEQCQHLLSDITDVYNGLKNDETSIIQQLANNPSKYEQWNKIIGEATVSDDVEAEEDSLIVMNKKLEEVASELDVKKYELVQLNISSTQPVVELPEHKELSKKIGELMEKKQAIIKEIEAYEEDKRAKAREAGLMMFENGSDVTLKESFKDSVILKKLTKIISKVNKIIELNDQAKNDLKKSYVNERAIKYFKKNLQNATGEAKNVKKGKKKAAVIVTSIPLSERMSSIKEEMKLFISKKGLEEFI